MTGRISIPALREEAQRGGQFVASDGYISVRLPAWSEVLALVEAVEAAQKVGALIVKDRKLTAVWYGPAGDALLEALARFDFGEQA